MAKSFVSFLFRIKTPSIETLHWETSLTLFFNFLHRLLQLQCFWWLSVKLFRRYHAELRAVRRRSLTYESFSAMISTLMRLRRASSTARGEEEDIMLQTSVIEDWLDALDGRLFAQVQEVYKEELQEASLVDIKKVLVEEVEGNLKVG